MSAPIPSSSSAVRPVSRRRRWPWFLLGGFVLGGAGLCAALLTPAVQGWLVRRIVAGQSGLRLDFETLRAGPSGLEVSGLDFAMPGLHATSAPLAVRIAPGRLLNQRELRIERVAARKLRVTLTPAEMPTSPEPFAGLLALLHPPLAWALDEAAFDGEIAVREGGAALVIGEFSLEGGRVAAGQPGEFTYALALDSALLSSGAESKLRSRGTVRIAQGPRHEVAEIAIAGTLELPRVGGLALPPGRFTLEVTGESQGERYRARLDFGPGARVEFSGRLDAALARLSGRFSGRADQTLGAKHFAGGLPKASVEGSADVTMDLRDNAVEAAVSARLSAGDWAALRPEFAAIDDFKGELTAAFTRRDGWFALERFAGALQAEKSPAALRIALRAPFDPTAPPVEAPLARLTLEHVPLTWANPGLVDSAVVLGPGEIEAAWDIGVNAGHDALTLAPARPLTLGPVALKGTRLPALPAFSVSLRPRLTVSAREATVAIEDFTATTPEGDRLTLRLGAGYDFATTTFTSSGELQGEVPTLLSGPDQPLPFSLRARWAAAMTGTEVRIQSLELAAANDAEPAPHLALQLLQPFALDVATLTTPVARTAADWVRLRFDRLPLAWISRWISPRELTGTLAAGESVLRSTAEGKLTLATTTPWRLAGAALGLGGRTFFAGEAQVAPALEVHADRYALELREIMASHRDGSRIRGSIAAEARLGEKKGSTALAFEAELPALPHSAETFGPLFATLRAKSHNETTSIAVVDEFELRVRNRERELVAVEATAPFLAGVSQAGMFSVGTVAPLRLATGEIPLGWLRPWLPAVTADGVLQPAEFQLTAELTKLLVRPVKPVRIRDFSARFAGRAIAREMDFEFFPGLDLTLICMPAPVFQLAYTGTAHLTQGAVDIGGRRAVDVDAAVSFIGNDQTVLPSGLEYATRADFAPLSRVPALAGTGFPSRGTFVARLNGDLLGQAPLEFWSRLEGVPSADLQRTLPPLEISARGNVSRQQTLAADVAVRLETSPRISDAHFQARLNLAAGKLEIASALRSEFLDVAEALALAEGLYSPAVAPELPAATVAAGARAYPQLGVPFWSHLRGHFDLNLGTVRHAPYQVERVRGRLDLRDRELVLSGLNGEMFAGRWSGAARVAYTPEDASADHHATGEFRIEQFDSARVVQTVFPTELATVDAKIDVQARVRSRGNALFEMIDRAEADFTVEGREGVVRLNVPKQEMAATAAVFGGTVLLSPELRALGRLMKKFAEMPLDQLRISGERRGDGEVLLTEFRIDSPQARLLAHGRIPSVAGAELMDRPLELSVDLAARDEMAVILGGMSLIDRKPRADGYRPLKQTFELRGKAGEPDTRPLYDLLAKAVLGSKGTWGFLMRKVQEQVKRSAPEPGRVRTP